MKQKLSITRKDVIKSYTRDIIKLQVANHRYKVYIEALNMVIQSQSKCIKELQKQVKDLMK